jgi:UDP-2,3-diacylglucosamine hydrolase
MINIFISDLHLDSSHPAIAELFLNFLRDKTQPNHSLYILGDFFETWIGDDDRSSFNQKIIDALKQATSQGLPIYIMHGNRDFLLGKKFLRATGCKLLADEHITYINNIPTLLMHGDTLCTEDKKYLKFRRKVRCWLVQKLFLLKSLKKRQQLADAYRQASKQYTSTTPEHIMDVTQTEVVRVMQKHGAQHLIHGHTHREGIHQFELNGKTASRTVLGAWHEHGSALICGKDKPQLINFNGI